MNSPRSLWSDRPLTAGIATLVCYAGVFSDVIGVEEMASRLGVSGSADFYTALDELQRQGRIRVQDGFAGLPDLGDQFAIKASKIATARRLIQSRLPLLRKFGRIPIVEFVGISGSLAAENPVRDRNNQLDIDIFLIARPQCLWLNRLLFGIRHVLAWREAEPALCVNYVMDASHLVVINKNFYTATEIRNVIPVSGLETYRQFLQANRWADYYYPELSAAGQASPAAVERPMNQHVLLRVMNLCCYLLCAILRSIRWLDLGILRRISLKTDLHRGASPNLSAQACGGYQASVQTRFGRLAEAWFAGLLDHALIDQLFPDELSVEIKQGDDCVAGILHDEGFESNFSKYAQPGLLPERCEIL